MWHHYKKNCFLRRQNAVANALDAVANTFCDGNLAFCDGKGGSRQRGLQKSFSDGKCRRHYFLRREGAFFATALFLSPIMEEYISFRDGT